MKLLARGGQLAGHALFLLPIKGDAVVHIVFGDG